MAMPKATTVPQSAREWPRSRGRQTRSRTTAAARRRRVTTPGAPARGIRVTASAPPNCTETPPASTSPTGPREVRRPGVRGDFGVADVGCAARGLLTVLTAVLCWLDQIMYISMYYRVQGNGPRQECEPL